MSGTDIYARKLYQSDLLREPVIRNAIRALQLQAGSKGLDAGCGIGSHTVLLADTVMPDGHVTGLDVSPEFLAHAKITVEKAGLSGHVTFQEGSIDNLPFGDNTFDWLWSVDCAGYAPCEPFSLVRELARVVKPGGKVAILGWSSQQFLPGHPLLEARLNATSQGIAPFAKGNKPELHFLRTTGWFRKAGLKEPQALTFAGNVQAPLNSDVRAALISLIEMRWGSPETGLSQDDMEEYQRICNPKSPDFIVDNPDYYAFFTYTMFVGSVDG